jgi:hypothetical protein
MTGTGKHIFNCSVDTAKKKVASFSRFERINRHKAQDTTPFVVISTFSSIQK